MLERLTPELRTQLEQVPLRRGHLLERVEAWLAADERLGELEEERARLEQPTGPSTGKQIADARNGWIRVVNAFLGMAALAELDEAQDRAVFGPLRDAEMKARRQQGLAILCQFRRALTYRKSACARCRRSDSGAAEHSHVQLARPRRGRAHADVTLTTLVGLSVEDKSFKRGDAPAQRLLKAPGHGFAFAARP